MSEESAPTIGKVLWQDLTVSNALEVRDFYADVVGWTFTPEVMGDYEDYNMKAAGGETVAGICHRRGSNANIPTAWLIYIEVADIAASVQMALDRGGNLIDGPRHMGEGGFAVIQDPAGAYVGLWQRKATVTP